MPEHINALWEDEMSERAKVERLWDLVFALSDDDNAGGIITYDSDTPDGAVSVTLDGTRYRVEITPEAT